MQLRNLINPAEHIIIKIKEFDMITENSLEELPRDKLAELCRIYAKNWLAHDGSWFLSVEEKFGIDTAMDIDREAWKKFTVVEASRLITFLGLGKNSGIEGLKKALLFRLYSSLNIDEIVKENDTTLIYRVKTCRVQQARHLKGLDYFPCKSVGIVEYRLFAKTIDERFETEAVSCHPDITEPGFNCIWKFTLR
jgi:hypothetical protein